MGSTPVVSIIIATYNSGKILPRVLDSIKNQSFPQNKLEILLVDGGSKDNTKEIAKQYGCKVINNPRTEPVYAKLLGYNNSKGKYIIYLDHDEVLQNKDSLKRKWECIEKEKEVHAVLVSGYENPHGYPFINEYINEFGDPFSFFIYRLSKHTHFFLNAMKRRYVVKKDSKNYTIFSLENIRQMPIIELCAAGSMTDREYMREQFPETTKKPELIPHFFYLLYSKSPLVAVMKDDSILHFSSDTVQKYLNKIRWRVKNNIYHVKDMGESGYTGRVKFDSPVSQLKKYFYIPYVYLFLPLILDTIYLMITRRSIGYFLHIPLSLFTANLIVFHTVKKLLGNSQVLKSYDETTTVKT